MAALHTLPATRDYAIRHECWELVGTHCLRDALECPN